VAVGSRPEQWLGGGSVWWRPASRTRVGVLAAAGLAGGEAAARAELAAHFLLHPANRAGPGVYAGGGLAFAAGAAGGGRIQLVAGLEQRPGAARGWVIEAGLGGGVRLAAGWRWRTGRRSAVR